MHLINKMAATLKPIWCVVDVMLFTFKAKNKFYFIYLSAESIIPTTDNQLSTTLNLKHLISLRDGANQDSDT